MAVARVHTWIANEVLTASDLNAEFNNIINAGASLISPLAAALNFNGNQATNLRFETQSATQSAAAEGVAYWHTGEDSLHISTGTLQARVPALTGLIQRRLVGTSPAPTDGATSYAQITLDSSLSISSGGVLSVGTIGASQGGTGIDTSATVAGSLLYTTGAGTWATLAPGSASQYLQIIGGAPNWSTVGSSFTPSFTSTATTFTLGSVTTLAHGLAGIPPLVRVVFRCVTGEGGYATNDEIDIMGTISETNASGHGASIGTDATNITVLVGSSVHPLTKNTAADFALTAANWTIVARAWR